MVKAIKLKKYFKNNLIQFQYGLDIKIGRIAESSRDHYKVTLLSQPSMKFIVVDVFPDDVFGKVSEEMNVDLVPVTKEFAISSTVTWDENGSPKVATVVNTKGHKTIVQELFTKKIFEIPTVLLSLYSGSYYKNTNSLPELEGFYVKNEQYNEKGEVTGFTVAYNEIRIASVIKTAIGFRISDLDIVDGRVKFLKLLSIWMTQINVLHNNPVFLWHDWLTNYWLPYGISDKDFVKKIVKKVA